MSRNIIYPIENLNLLFADFPENSVFSLVGTLPVSPPIVTVWIYFFFSFFLKIQQFYFKWIELALMFTASTPNEYQ